MTVPASHRTYCQLICYNITDDTVLLRKDYMMPLQQTTFYEEQILDQLNEVVDRSPTITNDTMHFISGSSDKSN